MSHHFDLRSLLLSDCGISQIYDFEPGSYILDTPDRVVTDRRDRVVAYIEDEPTLQAGIVRGLLAVAGETSIPKTPKQMQVEAHQRIVVSLATLKGYYQEPRAKALRDASLSRLLRVREDKGLNDLYDLFNRKVFVHDDVPHGELLVLGHPEDTGILLVEDFCYPYPCGAGIRAGSVKRFTLKPGTVRIGSNSKG